MLYTEGTIYEALNRKKIDIGFTRYFPGFDNPNIQWEFFGTETASFLVSQNHPFSEKKSINFYSLCDEPLILMHKNQSPGWYNFVINYYQSKSIIPNIVEFANRMDELFTKVAIGLGISIVPSCAILQGTSTIRFIEIENEDSNYKIGIAWDKHSPNHSINLFIEHIKNNYDDLYTKDIFGDTGS